MSPQRNNRPRLFDIITQDVYDHIDESQWDWFEENVEGPVKDLICAHYGHEIIDDQCMNPEHRYCVYCMHRFSNYPVGPHHKTASFA